MVIYLIVATAAVAITSVLFFRRKSGKDELGLNAAIISFIGSIAISIVVPVTFSVVGGLLRQKNTIEFSWSNFYLALFLTFIVYVIMLVALTTGIARIADHKGENMTINKAMNYIRNIFEKFVDRARNIGKMGIEVKTWENVNVAPGEAAAAAISESPKTLVETEKDGALTPDGQNREKNMPATVENAEEGREPEPVCQIETASVTIPVDEAIPEGVKAYAGEAKNGEEPIKEAAPALEEKDNSENGSCLSDFINEAFDSKIKGDLEAAIAQYMRALDLKPQGEILSLIIADICILYKELGRVEMSRKFLEDCGYKYGDMMDASVRERIERNL